jgi:DNA-binding MarR family transcriptional regulator
MTDPIARRLKKKHDDFTLEQEAFLNLWRSMDYLNEIHDAFFHRYGLSPPQYNVLRILRGERPNLLAMSEIKSRLVARAPDVTRIVDRLVKQGFCTREIPEHDRRTVLARITRKGQDLLRRMDKPLLQCHNEQLGHLSELDLKHLIELLEKVRKPHESRRSTETTRSTD